MNAIMWMALGAAVWTLAGLIWFATTEAEFRRVVAEVLLAVLVGPALLLALALRNRAPRVIRLSPEALSRFARQQAATVGRPAWLLAYRDRGLIVVRRNGGTDPLNNVGNRGSQVAKEVRSR